MLAFLYQTKTELQGDYIIILNFTIINRWLSIWLTINAYNFKKKDQIKRYYYTISIEV